MLRGLVDELGKLIEQANPFAEMKFRGNYSPTPVIRAALDYTSSNLDPDTYPVEQFMQCRRLFLEHRHTQDSASSCNLSNSSQDQLDELRTAFSSDPEISELLVVGEAGGTKIPRIIVIFLALLFTRDALKQQLIADRG